MSSSQRTLALNLAAVPGDPARQAFVLAVSGGLDSTVLAHAFDTWARRHDVTRLRIVHVDHGLHADSALWAKHCAQQAADLGRPYRLLSAGAIDARAGGLEAAARDARYAALAKDLAAGEVLVTAHHLDDQCETLLLALARGSGPKGLAAMPVFTRFGRGWHLRPLLATARSALRDYAGAHRLDWIDDPSNSDERHQRNFLRARVVPVLEQRWPAFARNVAVSAEQCASADRIVDAAIGAMLDRLGSADQLPIERIAAADDAPSVLRVWLSRNGLPLPPRRRVAAILSDMIDTRPDAMPCVSWPGAQVRRFRNRLYAMRPLESPLPGFDAPLEAGTPLVLPQGLGSVTLRRVTGAGIACAAAGVAPLSVRFRAGGERIRPVNDRHRRRVKRLLADAAIVPWMRSRLPLIYRNGELCAVGHLWLERSCAAAPGEAGLQPAWTGHPGLY